ncbi:MAG: FAD-dependent protein, partial [Arenimonas sp.]
MLRLTDLKLPLEHPPEALRAAVLSRLGLADHELRALSVFKRSYDARKRGAIVLVYALDLDVSDESTVMARCRNDAQLGPRPDTSYHFVATAPPDLRLRPVVIGTGPCGLFAALVLAQMGFRPIVLERGKAVRERTVDTFGLWRKRILDPESNVQFGEGGAGTFSDGKLYSQIKDPKHHGRKVLAEFVRAGAPEEILWVSKPHIGTFRLVSMVEHMRASIQDLGGEIRFGSRVDDLLIEGGQVRGLSLASGESIRAEHVVLAIGHSARDTFEMLHARGVFMEAKPFSVGFRIEHPQSLIDERRFGAQAGHPLLGAADYKLVHHAGNGRSVYSFCMCPGGTVVAAASEPGRVVTNGMSQYSRNERNANAGIVV